MSGHGVIFTDESVRAILAGRKSQTRRVVNMRRISFIGGRGQESDPSCWGYGFGNGRWAVLARGFDERHPHGRWSIPCPFGELGAARIWVKEAWRTFERPEDAVDGIRFRADDAFVPIENTLADAERWVVAHDNNEHRDAWRPSIFLPRWASRIDLRVTDVRVQRVQDISKGDITAEGIPDWEGPEQTYNPRVRFHEAWDKINGSRAPWASSPWVWAITFERVDPPNAGGVRELQRLTEEAHGYDKERKE